MVILILSLLCSATVWSHTTCESYDFSYRLHGRYCPTEGIVIPNLPWHQCKLFCLQTSKCQSINYNVTDNICTYFTATCPKASSHPWMAFVLFTGKQPGQYIEWIPNETGHPKDEERSVSEDNYRFVARMQKDGNDLMGYQIDSLCYSRDEGGIFLSTAGYPCQYIRIRDGCTVYFVNYELGNPLPPNAFIGGYTMAGLPVYIGSEYRIYPSYYMPASNRLAFGAKIVGANVNVKLLVAL